MNCPDPLTAARGERSEARKRRLAIPFDARPGPAEVEAGGKRWACLAGELSGLPPGAPAAPTGTARWYAGGAPCTAPREIVNPSAEPLAVAARLVGVTPLGERATLASAPDMQAVGDAVHAFLAADAGADPAARREMAARLLEAHGVAGALAPGTLVAASDALRAWADARFPGATWHREWPLRARLDGPPPRLLVGEADLVLELSDGFALVDHKSFPGGAAERDRRVVEEYAAQLAWYAGALERALRRPLRGAFVHFPLRGEIAEVELGGTHRSW